MIKINCQCFSKGWCLHTKALHTLLRVFKCILLKTPKDPRTKIGCSLQCEYPKPEALLQPPIDQELDDVENCPTCSTLKSRVEVLTNEIESLHSTLDNLCIPRNDGFGNTFTLLGRVSNFKRDGERESCKDSSCTDEDGCPTELSVLKREWKAFRDLSDRLILQTTCLKSAIEYAQPVMTSYAGPSRLSYFKNAISRASEIEIKETP